MFRPESVTARLVPFLCVIAAGGVTAVVGYQHFVATLQNFLYVLLVLFIPWSAVNLCDCFIIRRGSHDIGSFFTRDGGVYRRVA